MTKFEIVKRELENKTSKRYTVWKSNSNNFYLEHNGKSEKVESLDFIIFDFKLFERGEI